MLHVSQACQAQTPQVEQEKAWADGWQSERRREKSPRRLTRGERGGNGGRFGSLQARRARFFEEAVDRAKVLVRREDQELRQQEAFATQEEERQEEQRLAALEEQRRALEAQEVERLGCDAWGKIPWGMVDVCSRDL